MTSANARTQFSFEQKVAWLSRAEHHGCRSVELIETHMSCVFLAGELAYKMKKPVRYPFLDFLSLASRRANCDEEVRLNRRLARDVYLGVVALVETADGLRLDTRGEPVEYLVRMRRLPRELMLDQAIRAGRMTESELRGLTHVLVRFYRNAPRAAFQPFDYRDRLLARAIDHHEALASAPQLDRQALERVTDAQRAFLARRADLFDRRVDEGRIVEGHGDLRPEHVCLESEPLVIDCVEFSRDLRLLDPVEELGYLALECGLLGAPEVEAIVLETWRGATGDEAEDALVRFYQTQRALLRTRLALGHLEDTVPQRVRRHWVERACAYFAFAQRYADALEYRG